jgi:hypothetical protein
MNIIEANAGGRMWLDISEMIDDRMEYWWNVCLPWLNSDRKSSNLCGIGYIVVLASSFPTSVTVRESRGQQASGTRILN